MPSDFSEQEIKRQLLSDMAFIKERLQQSGEFDQLFVITPADAPNERYLLTGCAWEDTAQRDILVHTLYIVCAAVNARSLTMMAEAWVADIAKRDDETEAAFEARAEAMNVSEMENRFECVVASTVWRDDAGHNQILAHIQLIERAASGAFKGLKDAPNLENKGMVGEAWLRSVLPPANLPASLRERARASLSMLGLQIEKMSTIH